MNRIARIAVSLTVVSLLGACASGVTRMEDRPTGSAGATATASNAAAGPVRAVTLSLNADAKKLLADNAKFNPDALKGTVERLLQARDMIKADAAQVLEIEVTGMRTRSNFAAVMFGFMAGADNVEGLVTVRDAAGKVIKRAKVSASYALGGFAGGQDDARMNWLYEEFAKHTATEVAGVPAK